LIYASELDHPTCDLPNDAKVVICGGGAQGAAIAYKLALRGFGPDTVLLDQGALGGGTTWNSSGLISLLKHSSVETRLTQMSKDLYLELQNKEGLYTGWKEVGIIYSVCSLIFFIDTDIFRYFGAFQ
jgi:pyruvate dehydrogenase phosphatase regulatory subunit